MTSLFAFKRWNNGAQLPAAERHSKKTPFSLSIAIDIADDGLGRHLKGNALLTGAVATATKETGGGGKPVSYTHLRAHET